MLPLEDRELLTQTLVGLNIDPYTITSLMTSFDIAADGLEANQITPVPHTSFGDSHTGGYRLATNVEMAHRAVHDELMKVAAGLRGMGSSVALLGKDVQTVTDQTTASMNRLDAATACVAAPTFDTDQCTLPTEEG